MGRWFIELDPGPEVRTPWIRRLIDTVREGRSAAPRRFGAFVGLSLLTHVALLVLLLVMAEAPETAPADAYRANALAFSRALEGMGQVPGRVRLALGPASLEARKGLEEDIGSLFRFERGVSEADKVRFFRSILEAGGIFDANSRLDTETGAFFVSQAASGDAYMVDKIDRATLEKIGRMAEEAKSGVPPGEAPDAARDEFGPTDVPRQYLTRDCPYPEILARGPRLFTVFNGFPDLGAAADRPSPPAEDRGAERPAGGGPSAYQPGVILLTVNPSSSGETLAPPVLGLAPAERLRILDELMALGEADQLEAFRTRYLDVYDPDRGDLAALTREYFYSNLNGVFIVTDPVTSAFDAVEGLYLKKPVYETYAAYGRRLRRTKTGAALLLNLASAYDFERRTLEALSEAGAEARWVMATPTDLPGQHQPRLKAYVIDRLAAEVSDLAARMGMSLAELSGLYLGRQEEIYQDLTTLGGEVMNRALFDWGRLDWELGRRAEAIAKWKRADMTCALPSRAFRRIMNLIDRYDVAKSPSALADIGQILLADEAIDKQDLLLRHLKFGTWKKRAF
jgi:hypothetical protein